MKSVDGIVLISLTHWSWRITKQSTKKKQRLHRYLLGLKDTSFVQDEVGTEVSEDSGYFLSC